MTGRHTILHSSACLKVVRCAVYLLKHSLDVLSLCFVDFVRKWSYDFCIDHNVGTTFPLVAAMFSCPSLVFCFNCFNLFILSCLVSVMGLDVNETSGLMMCFKCFQNVINSLLTRFLLSCGFVMFLGLSWTLLTCKKIIMY